MFISETLLQNFAVNNRFCIWNPVLYEQIHAIFVMVFNTAVQLHLEKLLNSVAVNPYFFKKLRDYLF